MHSVYYACALAPFLFFRLPAERSLFSLTALKLRRVLTYIIRHINIKKGRLYYYYCVKRPKNIMTSFSFLFLSLFSSRSLPLPSFIFILIIIKIKGGDGEGRV